MGVSGVPGIVLGMTPPLFVTADPTLLDELLRLAAAAGVTPEVAPEPAVALRSWATAPLVLLGADQAAAMAVIEPGRRPRVHIVARGPVPDDLFRVAVAIGAEDVDELSRSDGWIVETLTDLGDVGARRGLMIGVVGGSGGAGATTLACALAQTASRAGDAVVVDCDPLGPGVDRVLGLEAEEGFRWDALCQTTGRLSARALREALPRRGSLGALSWYAGASSSLQAFAVREALSAARRGHDVVVVDLPRSTDALVDEVASRCDLLLVVLQPTVAGVASATRMCGRFSDHPGLRLLVRGEGLEPREIARVVGVGVIAAMPDQRRLAEAIDLGLGPVRSRRGALARASLEVLTQARAVTLDVAS